MGRDCQRVAHNMGTKIDEKKKVRKKTKSSKKNPARKLGMTVRCRWATSCFHILPWFVEQYQHPRPAVHPCGSTRWLDLPNSSILPKPSKRVTYALTSAALLHDFPWHRIFPPCGLSTPCSLARSSSIIGSFELCAFLLVLYLHMSMPSYHKKREVRLVWSRL